jgi:endothelin-converting enzyme/putative endopeptidase
MARDLLAVLKDDLGELKWMSDATRREALAKVEAYDVMVGYPDKWTDHSALVIRRDAFWADVAAARRFGVEADRKRIGQRTSRAIWQLPPSSPDAYIDVQLNVMGLPAGFLQPPLFDLAASDAVNYGAIGIGMAHDLTHAIDSLGADFDSTGQPRKWWAEPTGRRSRRPASAPSINTTATRSSPAFISRASRSSARRSAISPACAWRIWPWSVRCSASRYR